MQPPDSSQDPTVFTSAVPSASGSQVPLESAEKPAVPGNLPSFFYTQDDELDLHLPQADELEDLPEPSSPFVLPFQSSAPMSTQMKTQSTQGATNVSPQLPANPPSRFSLRIVKLLLIVSVILLVIGASFLVLAGPATPSGQSQRTATPPSATMGASPISPTQAAPTAHPQSPVHGTITPPPTLPHLTPEPTQGNPHPGQVMPGNGMSSASVSSALPSLQHLQQLGWMQAGLTMGDALEAQRTAAAFVDHEMSFDYRSIGTPTHHGGTLTSATFILTPGAKSRFAHHDKRMINQVLYQQISIQQLIQNALSLQSTLVHFQSIALQGQVSQFAWVTVSFELHQSRVNPTTGQREEDSERDPTTGHIRQHQLHVVLLRVPPATQGPQAPLGGTGWLVNTYALDTHALPIIATMPTL